MADTTAKDFLLVLPVIGTAVAVTFDVGYLHGIDINYFTLFSVSEHVAFALEALPFAISIVILLTIVPLGLDYMRKRRSQRGSIAAATSKEAGKRRIRFYKDGFFWFFLLIALWNVADVWSDPTSVFYWASTVFAFLFLGLNILFRAEEVSIRSVAAILAAYGFVGSFAYGLDKGTAYRKSDLYKYTVKAEGTELKARVVRSGERGLLFFESPSNNLRFVPWSEIKGITSDSSPLKKP
ncbi:hypothetical protein [Bradyrhizobium sp. RD5-C2]|uniref:hypothetical protein n=1 Tax=Bradyrhizobium sp. RD5-C2 TaxID=244562 RepID=UPI001CC3EA98|nr:hypothetical protein [Bradyrhizobium sp. RD5-C2]GIQ76213.1 hypothetical protein BraRD5C2_46570 [Bradyrhizobium sp. RD5-C2]